MFNNAGTHIGLIWSCNNHPILSLYSLVLLRHGPVFIVIYCYDYNRAFANAKIFLELILRTVYIIQIAKQVNIKEKCNT